MLLCARRQFVDDRRGLVELAGLQPHPHLITLRIGLAERTLRKAERLGTSACLGELRFRFDEIALDGSGQRQVSVRGRDRLVGDEPHVVEYVDVWIGQPGDRVFEQRPGGAEISAIPHHHAEAGLAVRHEPVPDVVEDSADVLRHFECTVHVTAGQVVGPQRRECGEQILRAQVRLGEFHTSFEIRGGLRARGAFCRRGEEAASEP